MTGRRFRAVLWDFGGVILSSPFEAFARWEEHNGIEPGLIRRVNATNPDTNAWARLERNEIGPDEFDAAFAAESAALGTKIRGSRVLELLAGEVRPAMVCALDAVKEAGHLVACLTNNVGTRGTSRPEVDAVMARFDLVVESSRVGCRKPEVRFYEIACEGLGVTPAECVFLDDLGINLKPAAAMGMHTIKVVDPGIALAELFTVTGIDPPA